MDYKAREFRTEESGIVEKHLTIYSMPLAIWEMQIKWALRLHLTPVTMDKIKETCDKTCCENVQ